MIQINEGGQRHFNSSLWVFDPTPDVQFSQLLVRAGSRSQLFSARILVIQVRFPYAPTEPTHALGLESTELLMVPSGLGGSSAHSNPWTFEVEAITMYLVRPALMQVRAYAESEAGIFLWGFATSGNANTSSPINATVTTPVNPSPTGAPSPGSLAQAVAWYYFGNGSPDNAIFHVPIFGMSCYYITAQGQWGRHRTLAVARPINGTAYTGSVSNPPGCLPGATTSQARLIPRMEAQPLPERLWLAIGALSQSANYLCRHQLNWDWPLIERHGWRDHRVPDRVVRGAGSGVCAAFDNVMAFPDATRPTRRVLAIQLFQ